MEEILSKRLFVLLAGALAIALVAAGCGSSSNDNSTTASLSKAEFLKQGNAICDAGNKEINAGFEETLPKGKQPSKAELDEAMETVLIPSVTKQVEEIRALGAPEGEEEAVEDFLVGAEEELEKGEEEPASLATEASFNKTSQEAKAIGLTSCAEE
jgi:hypothetical protein